MTTTEAIDDMVEVLAATTRTMETMADRLKELEYRVRYLEIKLDIEP